MAAIRLVEPNGPAGLRSERIETPTPGPGEALVRVHAAAITRDELDWPVDRLPATPSYELSGEVVELGPNADGVAVGDEVYALVGFDRDGVAAEYATVQEPPEGAGTNFIVEPNREQLVELARLADAGAVRPTVDAVFDLADARAAFERSLGDHRAGKIVLRVAGE